MAGVYVSYPFCAQKCTFCNFVSGAFPRPLAEKYLAALMAEIGAHRWQWRPETLYLGGGCPSQLEAGPLDALLRLVPGHPWAEATIEAPPGSITPERAALWAQLGLNRVSLGVQSFVETELKRTGRRHSAGTVLAEVEILRSANIRNFNIDLIAGLPGQTAVSWLESLDWIGRLAAPHVSVYMLEIDEDSRLGREILKGGPRYGAPDTPSSEAAAGLYEAAVEKLYGMGLRRYEISNFALPGWESRHNLKYWRLEPYAGFGADAHSFDGTVRSGNVESPQDYVARWESGRPVRDSTCASRPDGERFFLGLRLSEGLRPTPEEWRRHDAAIRRFLDAGLVETDGRSLRLTGRGVLLSNEVFEEFIDL